MLPRSLRALSLLLAFATASCTPTNLAPIGAGAKSFQAEEDEKRLWEVAAGIQQRLEKAGLLYADRELEDYLDGVALRLLNKRLDGAQIAPRVRIVKDPFLNAFALANGSIYFHSGLIARMENEAQLATVMGHELTHFLHRHLAREMRNKENKATAARVLQALLVATVFGSFAEPLPAVWAAASVSGYSRELETEADEEGLRSMVNAGYDPKESLKALELLKMDYDDTQFKEPFFFGTHPRLEERIENNLRLLNQEFQRAAAEPDRRKNTEEFQTRTQQILLDNAMLDLNLGRLKIARAAIEKHLKRRPDSPHGHFVMGELHRRSGQTADAATAYLQAVALDPNHADAHRELGLHYRMQSRHAEARVEFEKYLALKPKAIDAPIIRGYVQESPPR